MAEILSYNPYRDMHNDVQFSAMFFGKNIQNIPFFSSRQTAVKEFDSYGLKVFTFTGKERDSETGFSYFGARYYDSDLLTAWLSVDPLADKYPGLSPYAYCAWNPIGLIDTNGMEYGGWDKVKRYVGGGLNIAAGGLTVLGGVVIGAGGSIVTGGAAFPIGAFVATTGAYEITQGIRKIMNAATDTPESQDPQYTTPLGEATNNTYVDIGASILVGYGPTAVSKLSKLSKATSKLSDEKQATMSWGSFVTGTDIIFPLITTQQKDSPSKDNKVSSQDNKTSYQYKPEEIQVPFL